MIITENTVSTSDSHSTVAISQQLMKYSTPINCTCSAYANNAFCKGNVHVCKCKRKSYKFNCRSMLCKFITNAVIDNQLLSCL